MCAGYGVNYCHFYPIDKFTYVDFYKIKNSIIITETNMKNLVIGNTSQLSYYFPDNYLKISSRSVNFDDFKDVKFDSVYICFAEQRTFIENDLDMFIKTNVNYTLEVLIFFSKISNRVVVYGTSELWNKYSGGVDILSPFSYNYSPYIESKKMMVDEIQKQNFNNVIILHPYNFNSIYRKKDFLFGKIYNSIIHNKKIEIGDTHFYRELIHPKYVVEKSLIVNDDAIIGSGRLVFINDFIKTLYEKMGMNYDDYVIENVDNNLSLKRNINYLDSKCELYKNLVYDTISEIEDLKNKINV